MQILLTFFFTSLVALGVIHVLAIEFYLYWEYLWLDIPMHLLGGITTVLGLSILPLFKIRFFEERNTLRNTLFVVLCIGILWEVFEYVVGFSVYEPGFVVDTVLDIIMDLIGGALGYGIVQSVQAFSISPDTRR